MKWQRWMDMDIYKEEYACHDRIDRKAFRWKFKRITSCNLQNRMGQILSYFLSAFGFATFSYETVISIKGAKNCSAKRRYKREANIHVKRNIFNSMTRSFASRF